MSARPQIAARVVVAVAAASVIVGVVVVGAGAGGCAPADPGTVPFDREHKVRALQLISVFENGTIELQYAYVEDIGDGRGYTCGLGFTTATGDALEVVRRYTDAVPDNALAPLLPVLAQRAADESGDTAGLEAFPAAWAQSASDPQLQAIEEAVQDDNSYTPALERVDTLGIASALGLMLVFDTMWMHGDGDDDDGTDAIIARVPAATPAEGGDERAYLSSYLDTRRADLAHAFDADTRDVWAEALPRVDVQRDVLSAGNLAFDGPIHVAHGFDVDVP